jgi:hypothetical protein
LKFPAHNRCIQVGLIPGAKRSAIQIFQNKKKQKTEWARLIWGEVKVSHFAMPGSGVTYSTTKNSNIYI